MNNFKTFEDIHEMAIKTSNPIGKMPVKWVMNKKGEGSATTA